MSDTRAELAAKLAKAEKDFEKAGPIHRRDLSKFIRRAKRELRDYDRFHSGAAV